MMRMKAGSARNVLNTTVACGALTLVGLGFAPTAFAAEAQPSAADQSNNREEIVVTANKREEILHNVANSITAVTGRSLEYRAMSDFKDFAAQVPGLQLQQISAGTNRLIVRGENAGGGGALVGTVLDEIPLNFSTGNANGSTTTTNPDTYDMQRVEVLRGPQGTLYGAAAEGGLIKYVTNKPVLGAWQGGIEASGSTVSHGEAAGSIKGFVNIPVSDTLALRATGYYEGLPGWKDNFVTGQKNINHGRRSGLRLSALWQPSTDLKVTLQGSMQQLHDSGSSYVDLVGAQKQIVAGLPAPANQQALAHGLSYSTPLQLFEDAPTYYAYLQVDYDAHFAKITSITSHGIVGNSTRGDTSGNQVVPGITYPNFFGPGGPVPIYKVPILTDSRNPFRLYKTTQELRISSEPGFAIAGLPVDWQFGGMITREITHWNQSANFTAASDPNGPQLNPPAGNAQLDAPYFEKAGFADATVHFTPKFDLEFGGRYSNIVQTSQIKLHCCVVFGPADTTLQALRISQNTTTWSVAPRYHVSADTLLYARVATGFRPGAPQLIPPGPLPVDFPLAYEPDHTTNYEVGLRTYLLDKAISIDVAAYYIKWKNIQVISNFVTSAGIFGLEGNASDAKSEGIEWNLSWNATRELSFGLIGDVDNARLTSSNDAFGGYKGDRLAYIPNFVNTFNVDYHHKAFGDYEGFIGGTWTHTGNLYTDFISPTAAPISGKRAQLPAYDTFSMQAGLRNGHFTYDVYVHNLSNSRALLTYRAEGTYGGYGSGAVLQPRTIGFRISYKY